MPFIRPVLCYHNILVTSRQAASTHPSKLMTTTARAISQHACLHNVVLAKYTGCVRPDNACAALHMLTPLCHTGLASL